MTNPRYGTPEYRAYRQANRYGLTVAEVGNILMQQQYQCAICDAKIDITNFSIDHDPECCDNSGRKNTCGKCTRAILCFRCNYFVGIIETAEYENVLDNILDYLHLAR